MATRTAPAPTPAKLIETATKEAAHAATKTAAVKGHSVRFTKAVVQLCALELPTNERDAHIQTLCGELEKLEGIGKGYASNARRIAAAGPDAAQKLEAHCEDPANGWKALSSVFSSKTWGAVFPTLTTQGRKAAEAAPMVPTELRLDQREGALVALRAISAAKTKLGLPMGPVFDRFDSAIAEAVAALGSVK